MNKEIKQLHEYVKVFIEAGVLDDEFEAFAEDGEIKTIADLNEAIRDEISYWGD